VSAAALLLALPLAGLLVDGFRSSWAWAAGAAVLWGVLLAARARLSLAPMRPWLPWLAWAALSAALSGQPAASLPALARWTSVLAFGAAAAQLWGERERQAWVRALLLAAVVLGVAGLITGGAAVLRGEPGNAMTGLLPPYYNYTAFVEAAAFAASAILLAEGRTLLGRRWTLWLALAGTAGWLVAARSRGGLLAGLAGAALAALSRRRAKALLPAAAVLAVCAAAVTLFMMARGVAGVSFLLKPERARAFKRPQLWLAAAQAAADHPLLGDGPGQFEKGFRRHVFPAGYGAARYWFTSDHAHSEPLELAAETGFVGAALFAAALAAAFAGGEAAAGAEAAAALAAFGAMGAQCLVDNMLQLPSLALLFFGALACARPRRPAPAARSDRRAWLSAAAVSLALALAAPLPGALAARWQDESGPPAARLERAERLASLFPREPRAREALARALMAQTPPALDAAADQLALAARLAPYDAFYLVWRAELLRALGRWDEVEPLARRAAQLEPDFLQARLLLAEGAMRAGRREEARRWLDEVHDRRRDVEGQVNPGADYGRLITSFDAGRYAALRRLVGGR